MSLELVNAGIAGNADADITLLDNNSIIVPSGVFWKITSVLLRLTTTATVGNRHPVVLFTTPSGNFVKLITWNLDVAASWLAILGTSDGIAIFTQIIASGETVAMTPYSPIMLPGGYHIDCTDPITVDSADAARLSVFYEEYKYIL